MRTGFIFGGLKYSINLDYKNNTVNYVCDYSKFKRPATFCRRKWVCVVPAGEAARLAIDPGAF
jgi:hypothetical protein